MLRNDTPEPDSYPKLLSSHHSIYNALNNPLLDCTPSPQPADEQSHSVKEIKEFEINSPSLRMPRPMMDDPFGSFASWHPINLAGASFPDVAKSGRLSSPFNSNGSRPNSASILSYSTDEDLANESLVIVPSLKRANTDSVLVFETDEEDDLDDDENTLTANSLPKKKSVSASKISSSSFIMPKLSLSDDATAIKITILNSTNPVWQRDAEALIEFIQNCMSSEALRAHINHITLAKAASATELDVARNSSSLLVLNDGSSLVSDFLSQMTREESQRQQAPNVIVVNLITSNYFVNLFDIMTSIRPSQIIKTPSLTNAKFMQKMKDTGLKELMKPAQKSATPDFTKEHQDSRSKSSKAQGSSSKCPNYKSLERKYKQEILSSSTYDLVDPLNFSTNLHHLESLLGPFRGVIVDCSSEDEGNAWFFRSEKSWFILSFSVGIMVGVTLNACNFFEFTKKLFFTENAKQEVVKFVPKASTSKSLTKKMTMYLESAVNKMAESFAGGFDFERTNDSLVEDMSSKLTTGVKSLIMRVYDSANNGLNKVAMILFSTFS